MKKLFAILSVLAMVITMAGCGGTAPAASSGPASSETPTSSEAPAAEKFPSKAITFVVQSNPGGLSDQVSQQLAKQMEKDLGVPVTCVYKPGAAGAIGMTYVEASAKDGYTIGHAPIEYTMIKTLGYSNMEPGSCTFLGQAYATVPAVTIKAGDSRFSTIEEFIAYAKEHPGELKVGNAGPGSLWHLAAMGIEKAAGVQFTHVPFEGAAGAATALMGGHIDAVAIAPIEVKAGVDASKLKVIAVLGDEPSEAFPDVPTLKASGVDFSMLHWGGVIAPAGLPEDVEKVLVDSLEKAVNSEDFKSFLKERAMESMFRTGEEMDTFVQQQFDYFKEAIPAAMGK